ncbi:MAG: glycosyltransferase family 2 protein, partial [Armatimonadota bacterium]
MPTVSVVIPTYNRALLVERAIRSVLGQTYTDFEVIVVDDGSTDDTKRILADLAHEDPRVRWFHHSENRGAQAARNTGCRAAEGEYIAFLDSDNEWLSNKLHLQMELLKEHGEYIGVVYCGFRVIYPDHRFFD